MPTWDACPTCGEPTNTLVCPERSSANGTLACPKCYKVNKPTNTTLHQTVDSWVGKDGKKHRISGGKNWEISHRQISQDDKKTVINSVTGKLPEY